MVKNKSVFFLFIAIILGIGCFINVRTNKVFANNQFKSKSVYLIDYNTGTELYKQNENEKLPIASMCKIMTLNLCFDAIEDGKMSLNDTIKISKSASSMGGSQIFLEENGEYKVSELIKGIVVASANDACVALAEKISGSEQTFIEKMNEKAQELGMNDTNFVNCTGLPKAGQYSTAKDVAKMFSELLTHSDYYGFSGIWMDEIQHSHDRITQISNTNKLIRYYDGCDSGKTGYTSEAGHCVCASAKRNDMRLISVVISAPDSKTRFYEASSLFNYGFANYTNKLIIDKEKPVDFNGEVLRAKEQLVVYPENSFYSISKIGEKDVLEFDIKFDLNLKAPLNKGDKVGQLSIYKNSIEIGCVNLISGFDVNEKNIFDYFNDISCRWQVI